MPKFNRIADVKFAVGNTQQRIEVKHLPYVWDSDESYDMDFPGAVAAIAYLRKQGFTAGLNLIVVSTSPTRRRAGASPLIVVFTSRTDP